MIFFSSFSNLDLVLDIIALVVELFAGLGVTGATWLVVVTPAASSDDAPEGPVVVGMTWPSGLSAVVMVVVDEEEDVSSWAKLNVFVDEAEDAFVPVDIDLIAVMVEATLDVDVITGLLIRMHGRWITNRSGVVPDF